MYGVVVKPFKAYGKDFASGDMVDISDFPKADVLKRARYIRDASVDEVMKATGQALPAAPQTSVDKRKSPASMQPAKAGKPKPVAATAPPSSPAPLRQSRQARAKASAR